MTEAEVVAELVKERPNLLPSFPPLPNLPSETKKSGPGSVVDSERPLDELLQNESAQIM